MKAEIVAADEREAGARALLNLGHTFGHALEAALGYSDDLLHGEAVAAGMGLAFDYSVRCNLCPAEDAARVKKHLRAVGLPAGVDDIAAAESIDADALLALMRQDKKASGGDLVLILMHAIGDAFVAKNIVDDDLRAFLKEKTGR